jgi:hypothetical protein
MQWKLNIDIEDIWENFQEKKYSNLVNELCMLRFEKKGKDSWGDKTPHYILNVDIIYNLFPESKYLYIVRDGRDVALSLLEKPWGPNNLYACATYWKECNAESPTLQTLRSHEQILIMRYEDLLADPKEITKKVYEFLEEPYCEASMEKMFVPIKKANYNKWKEKLQPLEVKMFESVASNTLKRFGYETSYPEAEVETLQKWFWKTHDRLFHVKHLITMNTIDAVRIKYFGMEPFAD